MTPIIPTPPNLQTSSSIGAPSGPYNYSLVTFTVTQSGLYSSSIAVSGSVNTSWFLTGLFTPNSTTLITPQTNFFAAYFANTTPYTDEFTNLALTSGTQYTVLIAYGSGTILTDNYTLNISGPGCIAGAGFACAILAGNTYLASGIGSTFIPVFQGGTVQLDVTGQTFGENITLDGSTTNTIDQAGNTVVLSGVVSDAVAGTPGNIVIANSATGGSVGLSGTNSYTGLTTINPGAVLALLGTGSIATSSGVIANGTFDISGTTAGAAITSLTGAGTVALGTQTLAVTNASGVFSGGITGTGGLTIAGGTQTLTGVNTYTGLTSIGSGAELQLLGGVLASPVTVNAGATLRGTGGIGGALSVASGGTLSVGASPGVLVVNAPVTLAPGSTTSFDIDGSTPGTGAGHYSTLAVTGSGNALTVGGTLVPLLRGITGTANNNFVPTIGQQLVVATAAGGVQGSFSGLTQPIGLQSGTRFDTIYAPNTLSLVATPVSYGNLPLVGLTETTQESAIGSALDGIRPAAGIRMNPGLAGLFDPLYTLPAGAITPALDQLAPTIYADGLMAARQSWYAMSAPVMDQIAARRDGLPAGQTAPGPNGSTIWTTGVGQFTDVSGNGSGYHTSLGGAIAGIDMNLAPGVLVGVSVGGGSTQTSGSGSTDSSTSVQFAAYGGLTAGRLFLDGQASYLHADQDFQRNANFWNTTAKSSNQINGGGAQLLGGMQLQYGQWQVEPEIGFSLLSLTGNGGTETTGGSAAEGVGADSITSAQSLAGVRIGTPFQLTPTMPASVHGLIGWQHEYADTAAHTTATFLAAQGAGFSVSSAPIARDAARLGLGLDVNVTPRVSLTASYQAELGHATTAENLTGGIRIWW